LLRTEFTAPDTSHADGYFKWEKIDGRADELPADDAHGRAAEVRSRAQQTRKSAAHQRALQPHWQRVHTDAGSARA
jgi:hypothetical protein